jgi:hypothetical protein
MSLKAFHIFFISLSVVTAFFFGTWVLVMDAVAGIQVRIVFGSISFLAGIGLLVYGRYFLRKFKHLSFM